MTDSDPRKATLMWASILFVMACLCAAYVLGLSVKARAQSIDAGCTADRPHARQTVDLTAPVTCTLMACLGRLSCSPDTHQCTRLPGGDCNHCSVPPLLTICLSNDELRAAEAGSEK